MMLRHSLSLVILLLILPPVFAEEKAGEEEETTLYEHIKTAIEKGVKYLKSCQKPDGSFGEIEGETNYGGGTGPQYNSETGLCAFALYALLKCGVPPTDRVIRKGFRFVDSKDVSDSSGSGLSSYELSCMILALEAKYDKRKKHNVKTTLDRKTAAKRRRVKALPLIRMSGNDRKKMQDWVNRLIKRRSPHAWRYNQPGGIGGIKYHQDMSSTQFALLALRAATRCAGIKWNRSILYDVMAFCLENQESTGRKYQFAGVADGRGGVKVSGSGKGESQTMFTGMVRGFRYMRRSPTRHETLASGTMTTAGIASLLIIKSLLLRERKFVVSWEVKVNQALRDALQWVNRHWSMETNPGRGGTGYFYYYLYGLERCGDLQGTLLLGDHYWYNEGAEVLVAEQEDDGSWYRQATHSPEDVINTVFALLFLDRATPPVIIARYK